MSGKRYLLDTNAIILLLRGSKELSKLLTSAEWVGISVVSKLEFLSFRDISQSDKNLFSNFLEKINVLGLHSHDQLLLDLIVRIRTEKSLKLPDAIIAATAINNQATLVSNDKSFSGVTSLNIISNSDDLIVN
ncbi:MAG: type II toxin-antitoxin system VapC family toxin [Ignavibacteriales bacterium]|nr:MAG: type II toxin-antitoxin system VapC family toxin [Ignavibacteriales bacterium]